MATLIAVFEMGGLRMGLSNEIRDNVVKIANAARDPNEIDKRLFQVQLKILAKAVLELEQSLKEIATRVGIA